MTEHHREEDKGEAAENTGPVTNEAAAAEEHLSSSLLPSSGVIRHTNPKYNTGKLKKC